MQVLMTAAGESLLVWLTEHQSMQSDVPVASLPCKTAIGRAGSTACIDDIEGSKGMNCLQACGQMKIFKLQLQCCTCATGRLCVMHDQG